MEKDLSLGSLQFTASGKNCPSSKAERETHRWVLALVRITHLFTHLALKLFKLRPSLLMIAVCKAIFAEPGSCYQCRTEMQTYL